MAPKRKAALASAAVPEEPVSKAAKPAAGGRVEVEACKS